jgi:AraC-like DNA-binding protein
MDQSDNMTIHERIARYSEEREREFLEKVHRIVNEGMGDHDFGIDSLTDKLHISRAQLHRKLTALTGKSTSIFIRDIRLDKAREMLETGRHTITEVLYTVGYTSPSYFSKTYKERFGATPSELLGGNVKP